MGKRKPADSLRSLQAAFKRGDHARVVQLGRTLLQSESADSRVWQMVGRALDKQNQLQAARAHYLRALQRLGDQPTLLVQLGNVLSRLGEVERAIDCFSRAQALDPQLLDSYRGLLAFQPIPTDSTASALILRRALEQHQPTRNRARALFLLAQIHAEAGQHSSAFEYVHAGNNLLAAEQGNAACEYGIGQLRENFNAAAFAHLPPAPHEPCPLVIIAGLPRSGKSLLETLLATHPAIHAAGELALVRQFASELDHREPLPRMAATLRARSAPSSIARRSQALRTALAPSARYICDTSPANLRGLGHLALAHPEVPVLLCRRQPADLGLALYFKNFKRGHYYSLKLDSCGRAIARAEALMDHWLAVLPNPVLEVHYEDMVSDADATLSRVLDFLGLRDEGGNHTMISGPQRLEPVIQGPSGPLEETITGASDSMQRHPTPHSAANSAPRSTSGSHHLRLFPSRSLDGVPIVGKGLIGYSEQYAFQLEPLLRAYHAECSRLKPPPQDH